MPSTPDYYATLNVASTASSAQIREAYKRAALKHHPDRVSTTDPSRASRTKKFQEINDAYYVLSDPTRRRDYDATRSANTHHSDSRWQDDQFADIFEDMMREAGMNEDGTPHQQDGKGSVWSMVGGLGGAAIGFIVGNFPGMLAGAVAGNRLGAVRDRKGKSVYEAFHELPQGDRAKVLFSASFDFGFGGETTDEEGMAYGDGVEEAELKAEAERAREEAERRERRARRRERRRRAEMERASEELRTEG